MKIDYEMQIPNLVSMIFNMINEKIDEIGGVEVLKKAAVWDWWKNHKINDERDFDAAIDECYNCYLKVQDFKEQLELKLEMEALDEDPTNIPS